VLIVASVCDKKSLTDSLENSSRNSLINFSSSPSLDNNVNGMVSSGEIVSVKDIEGKWYHVVTPDNKEGYITSNTKYITVLEMN